MNIEPNIGGTTIKTTRTIQELEKGNRQHGESGNKSKKTKPVEAFINWESKLREGVNYGTVKILSADGMVWEVAVFRGNDEGPILGWGKPRRRQHLEALKKDYGKDLAGMAETWRTMIFNQDKGYELGSPLFLEQIKKMLQ